MADARASAIDVCADRHRECGNRDARRLVERRGMTMADHEEMRDMVEGNPGEAMTHSAPIGDPTTPGTGARHLSSRTPENADGEINPSAPGETGITPRSDR